MTKSNTLTFCWGEYILREERVRLKGNWGRKGRREIQKDELLIRSQLHDTINQMLRFAGCIQRSHTETLHLRAVT